ncbi:MAG: extracellular solute-binding protein [Alphaproteobacteria bacterium]|nr:extracellular solute-binding protein [Alphaproteobacteria bacterium]
MRSRLAALLLGLGLMAGPVEAADLTVWGLQSFNQDADAFIGEQVAAFGKSKGINAEYVVVPANVINDRLAAAFQAGAPPDAFMHVSQKSQFYIGRGLTVSLDDVLADIRKVPGGIFDVHLKTGISGGQSHALPLEVDISPMFVRTDLVAEVGMKVPTTWDELRAVSKAIQAKHPQMGALGMTVSTSADAEGQIRNLIWSYGGTVMAADGKTIVFDSPETRAAYQWLADVFLTDRIIPRAALTWDDSGNNVAYQTGRSAIVFNPPSIYYWLVANDPKTLANTVMAAIPRGPGPKGVVGNTVGSWMWHVTKASKRPDLAKDWLRWFYEPGRYRATIEKVGGRWVPIYPAMIDQIPLFSANPAFANLKALAQEGFVDGHAGPPNELAGKVFDANVLTKVMQKILVDKTAVGDAVAWGQKEIETLAKSN